MKIFLISIATLLASLPMLAQGWPSDYSGVMLQGFYWDSYNDSKWTILESQAEELSPYFKLVWIPQSGNCKGTSMGYDDYWWFPGNNNNTSYNSSFGTETQLRSMISTFKEKGIGTIADVVINHRKNRSNWVDFPTETYDGVTYKMTSTDICKYDDKYYDETNSKWVYPTLNWAQAQTTPYELGNRDTGEDWSGMRDLDHTSSNVQTIVKAYLKMLLNDLGYVGFRYDMVKGYGAEYTKIYNEDSQPSFSVGECWDGTSVIKNWINGTGKTSAAFDFQFKYVVRNAIENGDWRQLNQMNDGNWPLISHKEENGSYRQHAVTFVENHDTQLRKEGTSNGPLTTDTLAANAYMLAMPGTPCVFLPHWIDYKLFIMPMIEIRQMAGIKNTSSYENLLTDNKNCYAVKTDDKLIAVLGDVSLYTPSEEFIKVIDGYHYAYYLHKSAANTAWVSHPSGAYKGEQQVVLAAITDQDARIVYTTNGVNPTASSPSVASGEKITIPVGTTTLKAAMLVGGNVVGSIITRTYEVEYVEPSEFTIPSFCKVTDGEVCAFFEAPSTWTNTIMCYAWDSANGNANYTKTWPGVACTYIDKTESGKDVWKWTFNASDYTGSGTASMPNMIIFNNNASPQTEDLKFKNGGYYNQSGLKGIVTGIEAISAIKPTKPNCYYTSDGRFAGTDISTLPRGVYIINGKKVIR